MKKLLFCLISVLLSSFVYADNCHRTIRNNSNRVWYFNFYGDYGNVYFTGASCHGNECYRCQGKECYIAPHTAVNIEYTHTGGWERGVVEVYDTGYMTPWRWLYARKAKQFGYTNAVVGTLCPHILHEGATGAVSVNEPSEGDFVIEKDQWED